MTDHHNCLILIRLDGLSHHTAPQASVAVTVINPQGSVTARSECSDHLIYSRIVVERCKSEAPLLENSAPKSAITSCDHRIPSVLVH
jgi:hypothetical protein